MIPRHRRLLAAALGRVALFVLAVVAVVIAVLVVLVLAGLADVTVTWR